MIQLFSKFTRGFIIYLINNKIKFNILILDSMRSDQCIDLKIMFFLCVKSKNCQVIFLILGKNQKINKNLSNKENRNF